MPSHDTPTPTPKRRRRLGVAALYFVLPLVVFAFTSLPGVNKLTPFLALGILAVLLTLRAMPRVREGLRPALWVLFVLALVGSSGWFFSPFFFALYLTGIGLGFLYAPGVVVAFALSLIATFAFSIGEVNPTADFLVLLSLFSVIPVTIVLRKSFLLVQQERKGILILETDEKASGITSLDTILQNRVNRVGVLLRQPITYLRQALSLLREGKLSEREYPEVLGRMEQAANECFTLVKEFERGATKNVFLREPPAGLRERSEQPKRPA